MAMSEYAANGGADHPATFVTQPAPTTRPAQLSGIMFDGKDGTHEHGFTAEIHRPFPQFDHTRDI